MSVKRMYRKARRNICRAIYYWDECPRDNRKSWNNAILNGLYTVALVFATIAILFGLLVMF